MKNPVLSSCQRVSSLAENVSINEKAINETAMRYSTEELKIPSWDLPVFPSENYLETIGFFMLGNSINFAFRDFETKKDFSVEYKGQEWKGAMAMWASLKKATDSNMPILSGWFLKNISDKETEHIFLGNTRIPMLEERAKIFREVGNVLDKKYGGYFFNLVRASDGFLFNNGNGIVERLTNDFPSFDDSATYKNEKVIFNKRAQLAPAMLIGKLKDQDPQQFSIEDADELTVFADYGLPKVMRHLNILEYTPELARKVDNQEIIKSKSNEELEIRAATVYAADKLIRKINEYRGVENKSDKAVNALHIDYKLWAESRNIKTPHHLTPTINY